MATFEQFGNVFKDDCVFVDYLPINLHEEEVVCVTQDDQVIQSSERIETTVISVNEVSSSDSTETVANNDGNDVESIKEEEDPMETAIVNDRDNYEDSDYENSENQRGDSYDVYKEFPPPKIISDGNGTEKLLKTHACFHCTKMFTTHDKMLRHVRMFHKENVQVRIDRDGKRCWVCGSCNKTFISRKGSIIHQRTHTGERPYTCTICMKRFIDSSTLMKHQVIHQAIRPFTCHVCKRGFNQKVALQRHERTHSQAQTIYICKYCPKTFLVMSSLQAHEKIHSGIKPFSCNYCPSTFHTSTAQRQHERVHTNERPYGCLYCPKAFKDSGTLFKHQVIHSGIKPFVCPLCSQGFTQKVALKKHIKSHITKSNINSCDICQIDSFETKDDLCDHFEKYHVESHPKLLEVRSVASSSIKNSSSSPVKYSPLSESDLTDLTTLCDVAISTAKNLSFNGNSLITNSNNNNDNNVLRNQEEIMEPEDEKVNMKLSYKYNYHYQYSCSECSMSFKRLKLLKSHLLCHNLKLMCKYCGKAYTDRILLEEHEKFYCNNRNSSNFNNIVNNNNTNNNNNKVTNRKRNKLKTSSIKVKTSSSPSSGKRQFYCERCDKYFSSRNGYMIHQRSHTGERPYGCRWCEKAFGDSATRHKHERIHTGERPFKCLQCPRAFNQRAALRAHQITHSVDRAFICLYCPSSFPYAATLKRHCDSCHKDEIAIVCPICDKLLFGNDNLHLHVKSDHIVNNKPCVCPLCDSGIFTNNDEFADHILWHAKQIPSNNSVSINNNINKVVNNNNSKKSVISNNVN